MFCNNCGTKFEDGQRFCSKCGSEVTMKKEELVCPHCGKPTGEGKKFCNFCGGSLTVAEKKFCRHCGNELESEEQFCKKCGNRVEMRSDGASFEAVGGAVKNFVTNSLSDIKSSYAEARRDKHSEAFLRLGQYILCALSVLSLIFCFIPTFKLDVGFEEINITIGNIMGSSEISALGEVTELWSLTLVSVMVVLLCLGSVIVAFLPLINKTVMKRRRFKLQQAFAGGPLGALLAIWALIWVVNAGTGMNVGSCTFGGFMFLALNLALAIFSEYLSYKNEIIIWTARLNERNVDVKNESGV